MIPRRLTPHRVTVEPYLGSGAEGDIYGPAHIVRGRVSLKRQLVVGKNAEEMLSEATVCLPLGTLCPPGSLVTLPGETVGREVLTATLRHGARQPHHLEVTTR